MTKQFLITLDLIQKFKDRLAVLDREIAEKSEERQLVLRWLDAIPLFLSVINGEKPQEGRGQVHEVKLGETVKITDEEPRETSLPMAIKTVLQKRGRLGATEIRDVILSEGLVPAERLGASFSYLYTALTRLRQKKQIERVRGEYQLPHGVTIQLKPEEEDLKS